MSSFFRRLARPTVHSLLGALGEATNAANERERALDQTGEFWTAFLAEIRGEPQGVRCWSRDASRGSPAVGLAWWTDPRGTRHFAVRGDPSGLREMRHQPLFPPVWHLCPERVFRRDRDQKVSWLALCDCGACGEPESIGWAADHCGDCSLGTTGPDRPGLVATLRGGVQVEHLAFSPDGGLLAAGGQGRVALWETRTRALRGQLERVFPQVQGVIFDHDSRRIGVAGGDRLLRWFDAETGEEKESIPVPKEILYLGLSRDGKVLAACGKTDQEAWHREQGTWSMAFALSKVCTAACLSPSGKCLALGGRGWRGVHDGEFRFLDTLPRYMAPNQPDTRNLLFAFNEGAALTAYTASDAGGYRLSRISKWNGLTTWSRYAEQLERPTFNAEGLWFGGFANSVVVLYPAYDHADGVALRPHAGKLTALAFAPDNETLAFAAEDGSIRLWPWRRMVVA